MLYNSIDLIIYILDDRMYTKYRNIIIENADKPPSNDEIKEIEKILNAKIPEDFLEFLKVGNGGDIEYHLFDVPLEPHSQTTMFSPIYSTKKSSHNDFLYELKSHKERFQIPEKVLPIAGGTHDYLYLDLRDGKSDVMAFIAGLPAWTGRHQQDALVKIADNFSDYLDGLIFDAHYWEQHLQKLIAENETKYILSTIEYLDLALPNWREIFGFDYNPND